MLQWEKLSNWGNIERHEKEVICDFINALEYFRDKYKDDELDTVVESHLGKYISEKKSSKHFTPKLEAILYVLSDLALQDWQLRLTDNHIYVLKPGGRGDVTSVKRRLQRVTQKQLRETSVQEFIRRMETPRTFKNRECSIFSLMLDGRSLAKRCEDHKRDEGTCEKLILPYIVEATRDKVCEFTGLNLLDIWRYFRSTWSSPYEMIPGRTIAFLVRDASWENHPVIGISAISSPALALSVRDQYLKWDAASVAHLLNNMTSKQAFAWIERILVKARDEIYSKDLLPDEKSTRSHQIQRTKESIGRLVRIAAQSRNSDRDAKVRSTIESFEKSARKVTHDDFEVRSKSSLFKAKRARELAQILEAHVLLKDLEVGTTNRKGVTNRFSVGAGLKLASYVARLIRSKKIGANIADITVCGAIAPYNHLAAGKLVAALTCGPEAISIYKKKYKNKVSIIASSMAGRPITRSSDLVFLATTSLYGTRPNQYDRISVPLQFAASESPGSVPPALKFIYVPYSSGADRNGSESTQGIGSFHLRRDTMSAINRFLTTHADGRKVFGTFGEGTSPKLRAMRSGLRAIGFDDDVTLTHGIRKTFYAIPLISNLQKYLLGVSVKAKFVYSLRNKKIFSGLVVAWWVKKWMSRRMNRQDILHRVKNETHTYPNRHGARVFVRLE